MNKIIAKALAENLINLSYITRAAGCIDELRLPIKGGNPKTIPAATEVYMASAICDSSEGYKDLIPSSKEVGILYFEDLGAKREKKGRLEKWRGTLRLVCWLQVGEACNNPNTADSVEEIICQVRENITQNIDKTNGIQAGKVWAAEQYPKRPSPFEKYDYDEAEAQYLMYPYDYFSLKVEYFVYALCNCTTGSITVPFIGENTGGDLHYTHNQTTPSDTWTVVHNLGKKPSIKIVDTGDNVVEGHEQYIDNNTLIITFNAPFSGKAYLN